MLNTEWQRVSAIIAQYPAIDLTRQYKYLIIKRFIAANVFVFLLQYIGLMISTLLPVPSPLWFASGAASAMIFLRGYRVSAGIWLGSFVAYYFSSYQFFLSFACSSVFTAQAILLTWMTRRYIQPSIVFYRISNLLKFCACSGVLTAVSSVILIWLCQQSYILWPVWWLANLNGISIVAIALVSADTFFTADGKLRKTQVYWAKICKWAFLLALGVDMVFYLDLSIASSNLFSILILQILLVTGMLGGLFISLIYTT